MGFYPSAHYKQIWDFAPVSQWSGSTHYKQIWDFAPANGLALPIINKYGILPQPANGLALPITNKYGILLECPLQINMEFCSSTVSERDSRTSLVG